MVVDNEEDVRAGETNPLILERETTSPKEEVSFFTVIIKLYVLTFLFSTAFQVLAPAQTKIYEMIYCCQHRLEPDQSSCAFRTFPEHLCKTSQIQQEVSTLKGWLEFFDNIPGLVLTIPFGVWADRRGRRKLLLLSITLLAVQQVWITGVTMFADTLPLKAIWLEGLFNVFAGGRTVAEMLVVVRLLPTTKAVCGGLNR